MQVFSVPAEIAVPDFDDMLVDGKYSMEKDDELREKFIAELTAWLRAHNWHGKLTGEIVAWGVADGNAEYMVAHHPGGTPSMALIHLPLGDAYQIEAAHVRGLRQKDIRERVDSEHRLNAMFGRKK